MSGKNDAEMPGAWTCDKCGFGLQKSVLCADSGQVAANTSPLNEVCPNDGTLMRPLTWREANDFYAKEFEKFLADYKILRSALLEVMRGDSGEYRKLAWHALLRTRTPPAEIEAESNVASAANFTSRSTP